MRYHPACLARRMILLILCKFYYFQRSKGEYFWKIRCIMTLNVIYCRLKIYDWENRHCETLIVPEGVIMSQNINAGKEERTVDLRRVFSVILKRAWIIVTVAVISGLAAFFYTSWFVTPTYRASFSAYVNNRMVSEGEIKTSSSDMSASMDLMYVYQDIITSRSVLMEAVRRCDSTEFGDVVLPLKARRLR